MVTNSYNSFVKTDVLTQKLISFRHIVIHIQYFFGDYMSETDFLKELRMRRKEG